MENKEHIDIAILVVIATMGVTVLIFFIIFIVLLYQKRMLANKTAMANAEREHKEELLRTSLEIAEKERQRIAANLHDDIGITLNVVKINLKRFEKNIDKRDIVEEIVNESNQMIDRSLETVRAIHNDIVPVTLLKLGLIRAIMEICRQLEKSLSLDLHLSTEDYIFNDKDRELQLYRLIKEVLNNTVRHGKPQFIEINIQRSENTLIVIILHDGIGITTEQVKEFAKKSTGIGLRSILNRSGLLNADLQFSFISAERSQVLIRCLIE